VYNDAAMDEYMHGSSSNPIGVEYGTSGSTPCRDDVTLEHAEIDSFDSGTTDTMRGIFDGSNRQAMLGEAYPGRPDDYHSIGNGTQGTQPLTGLTTFVSYAPTHEFVERIVVPPLGTVSAQGPWSVLNPRDEGVNTSIADYMAIQDLPGTGTSSSAFLSYSFNCVTDSIRFRTRDRDGTAGTNDMEQSMMTIRAEHASPNFNWMNPSEYTFGERQYDQHSLALPQLNVPAYMPDGEGTDDGDNVPQHRQDQYVNAILYSRKRS
jgi:hypothetical protein